MMENALKLNKAYYDFSDMIESYYKALENLCVDMK